MNYYGYNDFRDYHLAHYGVVGMKWGVRRYQPYSVTGARTSGKRGKEIGLAARISGAWRTHRANKKRRANLEKARKLQAERDRLVRSGTAEEVMKNRDKLRPEDMYRYTERVQAEAVLAQTLQQQREQRTKELFAKADEVEKMARKVANYVDAANGLYKNVKQLKGNIDDLRGVPSKAERQNQEQAAANAEREKLIRSVTLEEALANQQNYSDDELGRILGREGKKDAIAGKIKQNQEEAAAKATSGTAKSESASTNSSEPKRAESSSSSGEASKSDSTSSSTSESSGSSTTKAPHQWLDAGTAAREVAERAGLKGSAADDFVRSSVQKTLNLPEYKSSFDKFKMSTPRSEADKKTAQEWMAKRGISFDKPADKAPDASWLKGRITNPSEARRSPADRPKNAVDIRDAAKERKFFTSKEKTGPSKIGDKGFGTTRTDQFGGWESRNKKIGGSKTPDRRTINISGEPAAPKATPSPAHYSFNSGASSAYSKSYLSEIAKRAGSAASSSSYARSSMSSILRSSGSTKVSDLITRYSAPETPTYDRTQSNNWKRMHGKVESRTMRHDAFMVIQNGIYYGNNDYRDYLAHHGVVGMHWGIRRYQPYGMGGYNRVGGKTGKMVGLASDYSKEQKREAKLASFKAKQGGIIDSDVEKTNRVYDRAERRIRTKYEKAIEKGSGYEKLKKIGDKYGANEYKRELKLAKLAIEKSKVMNYSYEDMRNENRAVLAATARSVGLTATSAALMTLGVTPIAVIFMPNTRKARTNARLTVEDNANAALGAKEIAEDTRRKLRGAYGKEYPDKQSSGTDEYGRKANADYDGDNANSLAALSSNRSKLNNKYSYGEAKPHPERDEYGRKANADYDGDNANSLAALSSRAVTSNAESGKSKHYDSEGNFSSSKSAKQFDKDTKFAKERVLNNTDERQAYERAIDWKYGPKNGEVFKKDIANEIKVRDVQRSKAAEAAIDDFISKRGVELARAKVGSRREADPISQLAKQVKKERKARATQKKKAETAERREERKQAAKDKVDNAKQTVASKAPKKKSKAKVTKAAPAPYNGDIKQLQNDLSTKNKYAYNPFQKNVRVDRNNARVEYKPILARKRPDYNGAYAASNTPVSERATQVWNPSTKRYENLPKKKRA